MTPDGTKVLSRLPVSSRAGGDCLEPPGGGGLRASQTVGDNDHLAMRLAINRAERR
jgi:hypothetical protein